MSKQRTATIKTEGKRKLPSACGSLLSHDNSQEAYQPFPTSGPLYDNLNKTLPELKKDVGGFSGGASGQIRSYKMTTVQLENGQFRHSGSGPNFQGGRLTLCTCMHKVRAEKSAENWKGWWIAGFANQEKQVWLFYLAAIERAYESLNEIWKAMPSTVQEAKSSRNSIYGDLYVPKSNEVANEFSSSSLLGAYAWTSSSCRQQ